MCVGKREEERESEVGRKEEERKCGEERERERETQERGEYGEIGRRKGV